MSRALVSLFAVLLAAVLAPAGVLAETVPESILSERAQTGRWNRFRVVTARSTFEFTSLRADSIGVLLRAAPRRSALLTTPDARRGAANFPLEGHPATRVAFAGQDTQSS